MNQTVYLSLSEISVVSQCMSHTECSGSLQTYSEELVQPERGGAEHEADEDQSEELVSVELEEGLVCGGQREGPHEIKRHGL